MRTAAAILLLMIALAGCAYPVEVAPPQANPFAAEGRERPPSPEQWLDRVCTALGPVARPTPPPTISPADLAGSKQAFLDYLGARTGAVEEALRGVNEAGPAPSPAGQAVSEPVARALLARTGALTQARATLDPVPPSSEVLLRTLQQVAAQLPPSAPQVTLTDLALPPDLQAVAPTVPSCRQLG